MRNTGYKVVHVHPAGVYVVFWKLVNKSIWLPLGDYVQDNFGNLVEV